MMACAVCEHENSDTFAGTEIKGNLGHHCPKQSQTRNYTNAQDFEEEGPRFSSKTCFWHFSAATWKCVSVCVQDTLSWQVYFKSSAEGCPVPTILCKELCFWAFFSKTPPGNVDESIPGDYKMAWVGVCRMKCPFQPVVRMLLQSSFPPSLFNFSLFNFPFLNLI